MPKQISYSSSFPQVTASHTKIYVTAPKQIQQHSPGMFLKLLRGVLLLASTAVAIPYTVAIVSNVLYGWPQTKHKYKRALSPRKVFGLSYVLLQMLRDKTVLLPLCSRWRTFYRNTNPKNVCKNLVYGRNDCTLDVYKPSVQETDSSSPVVLFVYGGSWSSGDKSMYGLLCSHVVANTGTVVVCPNYSYYPKGYVDDMIQDVVDCISWIIDSIQDYGGDKNKIILMGHSAGAHLCAMAILELLHDERIQLAGGQLEELAFANSHYTSLDGRRDEPDDNSSDSSESFAVVGENEILLEQSASGSAFDSSGTTDSLPGANQNSEFFEACALPEGQETLGRRYDDTGASGDRESEVMSGDGTEKGAVGKTKEKPVYTGHSEEGEEPPGRSVSVVRDEEEDSGEDDDSVVTVRPKDIDRHPTLVDMCKSVKAFIGLAGAYSIVDHFEHEAMRGIEDVSCMCRAHYGEDHFKRFSPTDILCTLGQCLSLPLIVLVHGAEDYIAPVTATLKFANALTEISANVKVKIIPDCNHYEICTDLMESNRKFYSHVMGIIMETVKDVS